MRKEEKGLEKKEVTAKKGDLSSGSSKRFDSFSNGPEPFSVVATDPRLKGEFLSDVDDKGIMTKLENKNIYEVTISNQGGLVLPVIIQWSYADGSKEIDRIPAEIWRINEKKINKVFIKEKEVVNIVLDPHQELTDIDLQDNVFPKSTGSSSKFDSFKKKAN